MRIILSNIKETEEHVNILMYMNVTVSFFLIFSNWIFMPSKMNRLLEPLIVLDQKCPHDASQIFQCFAIRSVWNNGKMCFMLSYLLNFWVEAKPCDTYSLLSSFDWFINLWRMHKSISKSPRNDFLILKFQKCNVLIWFWNTVIKPSIDDNSFYWSCFN